MNTHLAALEIFVVLSGAASAQVRERGCAACRSGDCTVAFAEWKVLAEK